jgi:CRISPR-associated protein Cas2
MIVFLVENAQPSLRGVLSRWMLQLKPGVFVGKLSARVRDKLWEKVIHSAKVRGALLIYQAPTEQGFEVRSYGQTDREPVEFEGLTLIRRPTESKQHKEHYRKRGQEPTH